MTLQNLPARDDSILPVVTVFGEPPEMWIVRLSDSTGVAVFDSIEEATEYRDLLRLAVNRVTREGADQP
jgi:hypothetical protein